MATCSSVEVEFKATIQGIFKEALCIKGILSYLQIIFYKPIKLHYDNKFVIEVVKNHVQYDHIKYVEQIDISLIKKSTMAQLILHMCLLKNIKLIYLQKYSAV